VDATWVELEAFRREFPTFKLEDELIVEGGRDVMTGLKYTRQPRNRAALGMPPPPPSG
jgi:hypothetical protein